MHKQFAKNHDRNIVLPRSKSTMETIERYNDRTRHGKDCNAIRNVLLMWKWLKGRHRIEQPKKSYR